MDSDRINWRIHSSQAHRNRTRKLLCNQLSRMHRFHRQLANNYPKRSHLMWDSIFIFWLKFCAFFWYFPICFVWFDTFCCVLFSCRNYQLCHQAFCLHSSKCSRSNMKRPQQWLHHYKTIRTMDRAVIPIHFCWTMSIRLTWFHHRRTSIPIQLASGFVNRPLRHHQR